MWYYCIAFIDHMFAGGNLQSFNKMFDPNDFDLNDKIIYDMFAGTCYKYIMDNTYCVSERKYTGNIDPKVFRTKNNRYVVKSKCPSCGRRKSKFVRKQEAQGVT